MVNYPTRKKKQNIKPTQVANLGMTLETDINASNAYYLHHNIANVHKKPTPIQIVSVSYPAREKAKITEAYYKKASTTDYNGVYKGYPLDFEAKETKNKTRFPLQALPHHQYEHLKNVAYHGAIAFIIVRFVYFNETYLLYFDALETFVKTHSRKSIPYEYFQKHAKLIPLQLNIPVHYLAIIQADLAKGAFNHETEVI